MHRSAPLTIRAMEGPPERGWARGVPLRWKAARAAVKDMEILCTSHDKNLRAILSELLAQAADVEAVRQTGRAAVVPRGDDALVMHDDGANSAAQTGRARSNSSCNIHEVFVPAWTCICHGRVSFICE